MADTDIVLAVKDALREALNKAANEEIEKLQHRFKCEMGKTKSALIGDMVNNVRIAASHELPNNEYVIQIVLRGN